MCSIPFLLSLQLASMSLKEKESGKASFAAEKKKSKPTTNSFLKKSVLVVIKHVYNWQLILSTGEILFIHLRHKITRKIMLVINPHVLNAVWGFWECHVYLLWCHRNPSPPTNSPDTLPTMLSPLWCTYQPISPLILFTWMWTMLWCLTDSGWARSPVFRERTIFLFHMASLWVSVLPGKEFLVLRRSTVPVWQMPIWARFTHTHTQADQMLCGPFHPSQSPKQYIVSSQEFLPQTLYQHMQTCTFWVIRSVSKASWCLPTICFIETFMAMFTLY